MCPGRRIALFGADPIEPTAIVGNVESVFLDDNLMKTRQVIACFVGWLADVRVVLTITIDYRSQVIGIGVLEDFLWNFSGNPANAEIGRLHAYAEICSNVATLCDPTFGYLGTESVHINEMSPMQVSVNGARERFTADFFSQSNLRELYDWYVTEYVRRWELS